jgi:hypothetical protein
MTFTDRELALIMVALDNTAHWIRQHEEDGDLDGIDDFQVQDMNKLWDRIRDQWAHQQGRV